MKEVEKILANWDKKKYKPVYWLEGEEPYYIDQLTHFAEHNILSESEASFNLSIFYGKDADWASVVNACKRYPMFGETQVVLLKEAQQMRDIDKLESYIDNPLNSTIFIVAYKEKKLDARTKFAKLVKQKGELVSTKKLYENQITPWTEEMIKRHGLTITHKALFLIIDNVGNDLSRLQNEIEKLKINLEGRTNITEDDIEKYIGISKDFNPFELQDAIANRNMNKTLRIIQYFKANPKAGPIQLLLPTLYSFFSKLYVVVTSGNTSENNIKQAFNFNPVSSAAAVNAIKAYNFHSIEKILLLLHEYNLRAIGVNDGGTEDADLLKEMAVRMMS